MPLSADTSSCDVLKPNTDGLYEFCDGTYVIHQRDGSIVYYVAGEITIQAVYDAAVLVQDSIKTDKERIIDLEAEIEKLKTDVISLQASRIN